MTPDHQPPDPQKATFGSGEPHAADPSGVPLTSEETSLLDWNAGHWQDMTATLTPESIAELRDWVDHDLAALEVELSHFITGQSLKKSLRR